MRNSVFLTDDLSAADLNMIQEVAMTDDASFANLVKIGKMDPKTDFRNANLRGMDFSGADLRGFDFTGSDLRGTYGADYVIDSSTILDNAVLDDSIFVDKHVSEGLEHEVYASLRGAHWTNQILILEREMRRDDIPLSAKLATASILHSMSKDSFIRRNALRAISKLVPVDEFIRVVRFRMHSADTQSIEFLSSALHIVDELYKSSPIQCLRFLVELLGLKDAYATQAAGSIARNIAFHDLLRMASYVKKVGGPLTRRAFVAGLAMRLGPVQVMLVRDPISNEVFDIGSAVSDEQYKNIVRAVARRVRTESLDRSTIGKPFSEALDYPRNEATIDVLLRKLYRELARAGGPTLAS